MNRTRSDRGISSVFRPVGPLMKPSTTAAEPLVCLVIGQRLPQDVVDYPRKGKRLYRNSGQRDMVDIAQIGER